MCLSHLPTECKLLLMATPFGFAIRAIAMGNLFVLQTCRGRRTGFGQNQPATRSCTPRPQSGRAASGAPQSRALQAFGGQERQWWPSMNIEEGVLLSGERLSSETLSKAQSDRILSGSAIGSRRQSAPVGPAPGTPSVQSEPARPGHDSVGHRLRLITSDPDRRRWQVRFG